MRTKGFIRASLAAAAACVLAATVSAQERFTPHHVAKIRTVTSAAIAPDGRQIAYVLSVPRVPLDEEDGGPWDELHVVALSGLTRPFVTGHVNVSAVKWIRDGAALAFLTKRPGDDTRAVYVMAVSGGEARQAARHETDIAQYDITGDGRRIAFVAKPAPSRARLDLAKKGFSQEVFEESAVAQRVWIGELKDGALAGPARALDLPGHASQVIWSPDGSRLLVIHAPTPLVDDDLMLRRIWIVNPESGAVQTKIDNPGKLGQVAWSPDGRNIAMVSAADDTDPSEGRLMVVPAGGGTLRDLRPDYDAHIRAFAWKDAGTLIYAADEGVESALGEAEVSGGGRVLAAKGLPIVAGLDRAKDGTLALVGDTPQHPQEAFFVTAGAAPPRRATDSNPWLSSMRMAKQEIVTYKARDGLELQGILVRPLDEQPGTAYPLILTVHGGPEARDANGWRTGYSNPGQVAAAAGFAVFYPNYRGSTGRGVAFSKMGHGEPAGKEFDDLVDGVDHLVATGLVDRAKVGITGGSYGGYASAWGATYYTERFAAAVMFVGISNNISKLGETDIANEEFLVHARKRVWDNWQFFLERSPVFHAAKSRTPTLILHGTADPRVHPTQSLEFYRHMKLHGKAPVRLVWYPGEGHGNRRAASRLDYNLRLMQWMSHYLKGPGGQPPPYELDYQGSQKSEVRTQNGAVPGAARGPVF